MNKKERKKCDKLWSTLIKLRDNNTCIICGATDRINAHHLITRGVLQYRWDIDNGVSVCPNHHQFSVYYSLHTSPWATEKWMSDNRPEQYRQWVKNRENIKTGLSLNFKEIYKKLEDQLTFLKVGNNK